jgi:hypothetical protein
MRIGPPASARASQTQFGAGAAHPRSREPRGLGIADFVVIFRRPSDLIRARPFGVDPLLAQCELRAARRSGSFGADARTLTAFPRTGQQEMK